MHLRSVLPILVAILLLGVLSGAASEDLPQEEGESVVARVNGEAILIDELFSALAEMAMESEEGDEPTMTHGDPSEILERMITARLIIQEGRTIGLQDLPETARALEIYRVFVLRNLLFADRLEVIAEPRSEGVEALYLEAVEQVRMRALLFGAEADARAFEKELAEGGSFNELADRYTAAGSASEGDSSSFMPAGALFPEVRAALAGMKPGQVSPVIEAQRQWVVVRLLERRVPENPEEREKARQAALVQERQMAIRSYAEELKARYVTIRRELVDSLDFAAQEPGIESYLLDDRVVAEIEGGEPVTVADLATSLKGKFFHGPEHAARKNALNKKKEETLQEILDKRVVLRQAEKLRLDQTPEYRRQMREYEDALIFGAFVRKVIEPDISIGDEELRAYLASHAEEYTLPAMVRLESTAFAREEDGRAALEKLERGADLAWIRSNAPGQLSPAEDPELMVFRNALIMSSALSPSVREAIAGAKAGDYRSLKMPEGPFYILYVRELRPERPKPFEEVRDDLRARLYNEKRQAAVDEYAGKLRELSEIEVYAEGESLRRAVLGEAGAPR